MKWVYDGCKLTYWYNDDVAYYTNGAGQGVFRLYYDGITWQSKQLCGTCDFSLNGCSSIETKKRKFRKWLNANVL